MHVPPEKVTVGHVIWAICPRMLSNQISTRCNTSLVITLTNRMLDTFSQVAGSARNQHSQAATRTGRPGLVSRNDLGPPLRFKRPMTMKAWGGREAT